MAKEFRLKVSDSCSLTPLNLKTMTTSKIYLLGFMGSGKSFVGQQLATVLDIEFLDLDDYI